MIEERISVSQEMTSLHNNRREFQEYADIEREGKRATEYACELSTTCVGGGNTEYYSSAEVMMNGSRGSSGTGSDKNSCSYAVRCLSSLTPQASPLRTMRNLEYFIELLGLFQ